MKKLVVLVVLVCLGAVSMVTLSSMGGVDETPNNCRRTGYYYDYCNPAYGLGSGCVIGGLSTCL